MDRKSTQSDNTEPADRSDSESADRAKVVAEVIAGPHQGARFEFERHETLMVGRDSSTRLCLRDDPHFSRYHFRLEINPPKCYLVDLGSRNGTRINGKEVQEQFLSDGDIVSGGRTEIRFSVIVGKTSEEIWNEPTVVQCDDGGNVDGEIERTTDAGTQQPHAPQPVPGYDVIEEIGRGAMGIVYRAIEKSTRREVALKVVIPAQSATIDTMQLFMREANVLNQLDHPRIVRFYEFGMAAGQLYLSMELIKTVKLSAVLAGQPREARTRIPCAIVCQVLEALGYAHARSLVHRDIKPSNILLSRPGRKLHVKLADFGLAKNYANAGFSEMTRDGEMRGTLVYMPPEQIVNCRYVKPAGDIFSVGATLYHYLTGEYPYDFSASQSDMATILDAKIIPLGQQLPDISPELTAIVQRAMAQDPVDRFASAEEMRQSLLPFATRRRK